MSTHAEYLHDITEVVDIDHDHLSVTVKANSSVQPLTINMMSDDHPGFAAGSIPPVIAQMFSICADHLPGYRIGTWNSSHSVVNSFAVARWVAEALSDVGVTDLNDTAFTRDVADTVTEAPNRQDRINKRRLLQLAVGQTDRPDKERLAKNIGKLPVPPKPVAADQSFEPGQAAALKEAARATIEHYDEKRKNILGLKGLGLDVTDRKHWSLDAETIIKAAHARDSKRAFPVRPVKDITWQQMCRRTSSGSAGEDEVADWAIINPHLLPSPHARSLFRMEDVFAALYPDRTVLAAASILHCLSRNDGENWSVLSNYGTDNIVETGNGTATVATAKGRNRTRTVRGTYLGTWHDNEQGLLRMLIGWTVLSRRHRTQRLGNTKLAKKFYCITLADPHDTKVATHQDLHSGARDSTLFAGKLAEICAREGIAVPSLSYNKLRKHALGAGLKDNPFHDVRDHSPRTRIGYLQNALPGIEMNNLAAATFDEMQDKGLATVSNTDAPQPLIDAVQNDTALNMEVNVCVSNGNDPDEPERPCILGIAACFTCPNGYRTADHVPGLLALVEFTKRAGETTDLEELQTLRGYATRQLEQFPPAQVEAAKTDHNIENLVSYLGHLFTQSRRTP